MGLCSLGLHALVSKLQVSLTHCSPQDLCLWGCPFRNGGKEERRMHVPHGVLWKRRGTLPGSLEHASLINLGNHSTGLDAGWGTRGLKSYSSPCWRKY